MLSTVGRLLFKIARSPISGYFIGFCFKHLSAILPVTKIFEDTHTVVFKHPQPYWEKHLLVVPKKIVPTLLSIDLENPEQVQLLQQILISAEKAAELHNLSNYSILVNGREFQDVPQLHFHIAEGKDKQGNLFIFGGESIRLGGDAYQISADFWNIYARKTSSKIDQTYFMSRKMLSFKHSQDEIQELFKLVKKTVFENDFSGFSVRVIQCRAEMSTKVWAVLTGKLKS